MSNILLVEAAAPETPSTNQAVIYVKADGKFYTKDDAGTESLVSHANPIVVADGGTGVATLGDAGVLIGNGTGVVQVTSAGVSGQILTSNGAGVDPTFQAAGTGATQAEMEAASSTTVFSSPGRQHFHPGHPKCWGYATVAAGVPTLQTSYNITSITDTATGIITFTIATDFSTANWCGLGFVEDSSNDRTLAGSSKSAGSIVLTFFDITDVGNQDPAAWNFMGLGDQA